MAQRNTVNPKGREKKYDMYGRSYADKYPISVPHVTLRDYPSLESTSEGIVGITKSEDAPMHVGSTGTPAYVEQNIQIHTDGSTTYDSQSGIPYQQQLHTHQHHLAQKRQQQQHLLQQQMQQKQPPHLQQQQQQQQQQAQLCDIKQSLQPNFQQGKQCCLFVGNPGVGKSTLLNCLMNKNIAEKDTLFKSGISIASGLTSQLGERYVGEKIYLDTPGLQDVKMRKEAAEAITMALKKDRFYQLVFVITLESGRIRPADVACIQLILECAKCIKYFGVIVNKLTKPLCRRFNGSMEEKAKIVSQLNIIKDEDQRFPFFLFLPQLEDLEDLDDTVTDIPELVEFMEKMPYVYIGKENVLDIPDDDTFEKYSAELEKELNDLKQNNDRMIEKMENDKQRYDKEIEKLVQEDQRKYEEEMQRLKVDTERKRQMLKETEERLREEESNIKTMMDKKHEINQTNSERYLKSQKEFEEIRRSFKIQQSQMQTMRMEHEQLMKLMENEKAKRREGFHPIDSLMMIIRSMFGSGPRIQYPQNISGLGRQYPQDMRSSRVPQQGTSGYGGQSCGMPKI